MIDGVDPGATGTVEGGAVGSSVPGDGADAAGLADDVRSELGLDPIAVIDPDCTLSMRLELGDSNPEVACLESQLIAAGALSEVVPDDVFDDATDQAVRTFQAANGLVVDGVVGPQTAKQLGSWVGPDVLPPDPATCPDTGRAAVVDRFNQRAWLCEQGEITDTMPITSAISQPDPGTYQVYAKDMNASSNLTGQYSTMTHFVAFTHGKYQGARIAFHSVPRYPDGTYVQPLDSVGTQELFGDSSGCIRLLPADAETMWNWLDIGDTVKVVT
jgi:peptidoglycan hydrolase-like protein with peptidoglycan-binding domain